MIKGVNRQIIEVHDTGSKFFDKVLIFVNSEYQNKSEDMLKSEAQKIIRSYATGEIPDIKVYKNRMKKIRAKRMRLIYISLGGVIGLAVILLSII